MENDGHDKNVSSYKDIAKYGLPLNLIIVFRPPIGCRVGQDPFGKEQRAWRKPEGPSVCNRRPIARNRGKM